MSTELSRIELSSVDKEKLEMFDYLAGILMEFKILDKSGISDWCYHERNTPENLVKLLKRIQYIENSSEE